MATAALSYMENMGELQSLLPGQSTVIDPMENRLDILRREFVRKVGNWPSVQKIVQMKNRISIDTLSLGGETQWSNEVSPSLSYKELVTWVDSWEDVANLISQIRFSQNISHAERISNRLSDLRGMVRDEDGENADLSAESIQSFFSFLKMYPNIRYPDITLTPAGHIYSRWKGDNGSLFSVEFLPDFKVGYVVFAPTPRHSSELSRNSGIDFVDTVFSRINAAFAISVWVLE